MSEWAYVAIAYTIVWAALAGYAVLLARRVTQAERVARSLRPSEVERDDISCDDQSGP